MAHSRGEILSKKSSEFEDWFRWVGRRHAIRGKVDVEDLMGECVLVIDELLSYYPLIDPFSEDFNRLLRKGAWLRVIAVARKYYRPRRDVRREINMGEGLETFDELGAVYPMRGGDGTSHPEEHLDYREFCDAVSAILPDAQAREVWGFIGYQIEVLEAVWEEARRLLALDGGAILGVRQAVAVIAQETSISRRKVVRRLKMIREAVIDVLRKRGDLAQPWLVGLLKKS